jgi:hypothetical protein
MIFGVAYICAKRLYILIILYVSIQTSTPLHIFIFPKPAHPKFNTITILTTDFHPIGRIHIISKDLTALPFHPIGFSASGT